MTITLSERKKKKRKRKERNPRSSGRQEKGGIEVGGGGVGVRRGERRELTLRAIVPYYRLLNPERKRKNPLGLGGQKEHPPIVVVAKKKKRALHLHSTETRGRRALRQKGKEARGRQRGKGEEQKVMAGEYHLP